MQAQCSRLRAFDDQFTSLRQDHSGLIKKAACEEVRTERVFGYLNRNLKLRTLKRQRLVGAAEKFTTSDAVYNLQRLAR